MVIRIQHDLQKMRLSLPGSQWEWGMTKIFSFLSCHWLASYFTSHPCFQAPPSGLSNGSVSSSWRICNQHTHSGCIYRHTWCIYQHTQSGCVYGHTSYIYQHTQTWCIWNQTHKSDVSETYIYAQTFMYLKLIDTNMMTETSAHKLLCIWN